jgi:aldose 1-epimerase
VHGTGLRGRRRLGVSVAAPAGAGTEVRDFGRLADGRMVREYTLHNGAGLSLSAINLGGIVTALRAPDRHGVAANVMLGLGSLAEYETRNQSNFGALVGRYGNRIAQGRFEIDGEHFQLAPNEGANALHGGPQGFGKRWWDIDDALAPAQDGSVALQLRLVSEHGDQGYPGRLEAGVRYTLTPRNEWRIDYRATCDRSTIVNLTHHGYFNLAGGGSVLGHRLSIAASRYCPVDAALIPEGIADVANTPFDFRHAAPIEARIREGHAQLLRAQGYDHNFVLDWPSHPAPPNPANQAHQSALHFAARLADPVSGRCMDIETTEPGLQFYSGNFLDGSQANACGQALRQGDGVCLETQHFPDSPNRPEFPSTVLRPGEVRASSTLHRFGLCSATATATATATASNA